MRINLSVALQNKLNNFSDDITPGASSVLKAIIAVLKDETTIVTENDSGIRITKETVLKLISQRDGTLSNDNIRKRTQQLNVFFKSAGFEATLKSRKDDFLIEITQRVLEELSKKQEERAVIDRSLASASTSNVEDYQEPEALAPTTFQVFASHKWHDKDANNIFIDFISKLDQQLQALPPSWKDKFQLKLFYDTSSETGFKKHEPRLAQQNKACEDSAVALVFWSDLYVNSLDCKKELSYFIDEHGNNKDPKSAIVLLEHGRLTDMDSPYRDRIVAMPDDRSIIEFWSEANSGLKQKFLSDLRKEICRAIDDNFTQLISIQKKTKSSSSLVLTEQKQSKNEDIAKRVLAVDKPSCDIEAEEPEAYQQNKTDQERIKILDELSDWAYSSSSNAHRVTVLLGDFGFGKTITCSLLASRLGDIYKQTDENEKRILPLYLDLKALLSEIKNNLASPVEHLLEVMVNNTGEDKLEGKHIIDFVRKNPSLIIFDGFDEIGQKLNDAEQQNIYHKLLDIIPREVYEKDLKRLDDCEDVNPRDVKDYFPSRILISCRTHFFNRVEKENSFLNGSKRHAIGEQSNKIDNVKRYYMAPFSPESIKRFIINALGEENGGKSIELIQQVHDLSELSSHPIMLKLITQHLPDLLELGKTHKHINAATLYLKLFDDIGQRDVEKHIIRLSDKQQLLAALALDLWREQKTSISIKKLDRWFIHYGNQHPAIKNQFASSPDAIHLMLQDLCNASLLVRDNQNYYRFAHTSYFEFFQALGVFETIKNSQRNDTLNLLTHHSNNSNNNHSNDQQEKQFNLETLRFLCDWRETSEAEEREEFDQKFTHLIAQSANTNEKYIAYTIWLQGHTECTDFPHSNEANWSGLTFEKRFIPKYLNHLDFSHINIEGSSFREVDFTRLNLKHANFNHARIQQCHFDHCQMSSSTWTKAIVEHSRFFETPLKAPLPKALLATTVWHMDQSLEKKPSNHLQMQLNQQLGHSSRINEVAWDSDGKYFLSVSTDYSIKLWDIESPNCILTYQGHKSSVNSVSWHPKGETFLSASNDGTIKNWSVNTGECIHTYQGHESPINSVVWHPQNETFLSASDDGNIKHWSADTCECIYTHQAHEDPINSVAWHPKNDTFLSASDDNTIKYWKINTDECIDTYLGHKGSVSSVSWNPQNETFLSSSVDSSIRYWEINISECIRSYQVDTNYFNGVAWHPKGETFLTISNDKFIHHWELNNDRPINSYQTSIRWNHCITWHPNGESFLSGSILGTIEHQQINIKEYGHIYQRNIEIPNQVQWHPQNNTFLSATRNSTLKLWEADSGLCIHTYSINTVTGGDSIAWHPTGESFLSASYDGSIKLSQADSGKCIRTYQQENRTHTNSLAWHPKGNMFLCASSENNEIIRLWEADTGQCIGTFKEKHVFKVSWNPKDDTFLSLSYSGIIKRWKIGSEESLRIFQEKHQRCIAWHPRGETFLSISRDGIIKHWHADSGKCLNTYHNYDAITNKVIWHPKGNRFLSTSGNMIREWEIDSDQCIRTYPVHESTINTIEWDLKGSSFLIVLKNGIIKHIDAQTGQTCLEILNLNNGSISHTKDHKGERTLSIVAGDAWKYVSGKYTDKDGKIHFVKPTLIPNWNDRYQP